MARYRADIDGLRATAIIAVVVFHVDRGLLPGGFTGVDVFFVVSGFLITGLLWSELSTHGRLDWWGFYARRARRLLPVLALTALLTLGLGVVLMVPDPELRWLSQSMVATALFASNVFFWLKTGGYFGALADTQPLLHTWSLAVEEQFYVVWPLAMVIVWRARRGSANVRRATGVIAGVLVVGSFVLAAAFSDRSAAFYLMPTRLWELAAGAALALMGPRLAHRVARATRALAVAGILLLTVSFAIAVPARWFPGVGALPAVLGTVALLLAGQSPGTLSRALTWRPLRFIGQRSYSWYLFHWPLLVFARVTTLRDSLIRDAALALLALGLADLTFRWVEQPLRTGRSVATRTPRRSLVTGIALLALVAASGVIVLRDTTAAAMLSITPSEAAAMTENRTAREECPNRPTGMGPAIDCSFEPERAVRLVLVGDSHALALLPAVRAAADSLGWGLDVLWDTGCPFVAGYEAPAGAKAFDGACVKENLLDAEHLAHTAPSIGGIVTTSRASSFIGDGQPPAARESWSARLHSTLAHLADMGLPVLVLHDVPHFAMRVPECVIRKGASECAVDESDARHARQPVFEAELAAVRGLGPTVTTWDPFTALCDEEACPVVADGEVLYRDSTHLSRAGAHYLGRTLVPKLVTHFSAASASTG